MADHLGHSVAPTSRNLSSHGEVPIAGPADPVRVGHGYVDSAGSPVGGIPVNLNPAGLPEGKEFKYERVEKAHVDAGGHAEVIDAREDRGHEDPGMNFKDKRPLGVPPGVPIGVVSSAVSGTAPEMPRGPPGPFIPTAADISGQEGSHRGSNISQVTVTETEKNVGNTTEVARREEVTSQAGSGHSTHSVVQSAHSTGSGLGSGKSHTKEEKLVGHGSSTHSTVGSAGATATSKKSTVKEEKTVEHGSSTHSTIGSVVNARSAVGDGKSIVREEKKIEHGSKHHGSFR